MKYRIHFWHGIDENSKCFKRITSICKCIDHHQYIFEGNLTEFDDFYGDSFMYIKPKDDDLPFICVTHHNSFAAR